MQNNFKTVTISVHRDRYGKKQVITECQSRFDSNGEPRKNPGRGLCEETSEKALNLTNINRSDIKHQTEVNRRINCVHSNKNFI